MGSSKWRGATYRSIGSSLVVLALTCLPLFAQLPTGTILGVIKDSSGGTVAGANVTVRNIETGLSRVLSTGEDGGYRFVALPVGHYDVKTEKSGFRSRTQTGIVLDVSQEAVVNVSLEVGTATAEVTVSTEAPVVNTTSGQLGGLVNEEKIAELPLNGRNYLDLTLLQPGVSQSTTVINLGGGTQGTIYSSNGAPIISNNYLLDGAPMQNIFGFNAASASGSSLGVDGIREYRVITNAFSAEYGMTMGSQMVIASKGGSNQFHGDVFEYLRNRVLDARNFFDHSYQQTGRRNPKYERNNFGGAFGGPIRKDRTFFWGVYEGLRQIKGIPVVTKSIPPACYTEATSASGMIDGACDGSITTPFHVNGKILPVVALYSPAASSYTLVSPTNVDYGQMRVDQNIGKDDSLFARYTIDNASEIVPGPGFGASVYGYSEFNDTWTSRDQYVTVSENHFFTPALLNSARLSFSRTNVPTNYIATSATTAANVSFFGAGTPIGLVVLGASNGATGDSQFTTLGPDFASPNYHLQNYWSLGDDVFYTKGKHAIKFGALINRIQLVDGEQVFGRGVLDFSTCPASKSPIVCFLEGQPSAELSAIPGGITRRHYRFETYGLYGQDDWRLTSNLTLNLGLRYEFNSTPIESQAIQSYLANPLTSTSVSIGPLYRNPSHKNFSPRLGFAYDPFGKGKTSIRGAFGIYYDISTIGATTFGETVGGAPFRSISLCPAGCIANTQGGQFSPGWITNVGGPFEPPFPSPGATSTFAGYNPLAPLNLVNHFIDQPYLMQWNLTVDQQLPGDIGLSISYVGTRGVHLWGQSEGNPCQPTGFVNGIPDWINAANAPCPAGANNDTWSNNAGNAPCQLYLAPGFHTNVSVSNPIVRSDDGRANCSFGTDTQINTNSRSWYDGLQVGLNKRVSHGLEFQSSYTWAKSLDTTQGQIFIDGEIRTPDAPLDFDKGPSTTDARHNWRFNMLYDFPTAKIEGIAGKLVNGWKMSNIVSIQSGFAITPAYPGDRNLDSFTGNNGAYERPSIVTSANLSAAQAVNPNAVVYNRSTAITGNPNQWFNPNMFTYPALGTLGDASRGLLTGPPVRSWTFSMIKETKVGRLGEAGNLEFRADFFNVLNHPNLNNNPANGNGIVGSNGQIGGPGAASLTSAADGRDIQFALKLSF